MNDAIAILLFRGGRAIGPGSRAILLSELLARLQRNAVQLQRISSQLFG
eukprot:COSAG06_NODE_68250_length_234_cov_5.585185_1_plen_48_part_10